MRNDLFWKRFEKTGRVKDYLEYACTSEENVEDELTGSETISDIYSNDIPTQDDSIRAWDERMELY